VYLPEQLDAGIKVPAEVRIINAANSQTMVDYEISPARPCDAQAALQHGITPAVGDVQRYTFTDF
jgi:hypothetical protein